MQPRIMGIAAAAPRLDRFREHGCRSLRLVCVAVLALLGSAVRADDASLHILAWSDYFDPRALDDFAAAAGMRIVYDRYASREAFEAKLRVAADYDVVVAPAAALRALIAGGALRRLDKAKLGDFAALSPIVMTRLAVADPGNQFAAPYLWSTIGLAFDADQVKQTGSTARLSSWDALFRPEQIEAFAGCGVSIVDDPDLLFALALRHLRLDPAGRKESDLKRAAELLGAMRRHVKKFSAADDAAALANGDFCLALADSGASLQARARARTARNGVDLGFVIPREGAAMAIDALAIPKDAPNGEAAQAFIAFMLRPEIAARNTNATRLANAVPASQPLIARDLVESRAIYPDADLMQLLFATPKFDPAAQKFIAREWVRIKTGR